MRAISLQYLIIVIIIIIIIIIINILFHNISILLYKDNELSNTMSADA